MDSSLLTLLQPRDYATRLLRNHGLGLVAYWPLWETAGSVAHDISGRGSHGTYNGPTLGQAGIGDGRAAPYFDGVNDFVNIYSAGLAQKFNGDEGTLMAWAKVSGAGVWGDSAERNIVKLRGNDTDAVYMRKQANNSGLFLVHAGNGTYRTLGPYAMTATGWFRVALAWSKTSGFVRAYIDATQKGALGAPASWAEELSSTSTCVGAGSTTPLATWHGYLAHVALWNRALTPAEVAALAVIP